MKSEEKKEIENLRIEVERLKKEVKNCYSKNLGRLNAKDISPEVQKELASRVRPVRLKTILPIIFPLILLVVCFFTLFYLFMGVGQPIIWNLFNVGKNSGAIPLIGFGGFILIVIILFFV